MVAVSSATPSISEDVFSFGATPILSPEQAWMDKHSPTSFEKEFNRLTFLASIATGENEGTSSSTTSDVPKQQTSFPNSNPIATQQISQSPAQIVNYNGITTPHKPLSSVNGFGNSSSTKTPSGIDIDKINEILNSNAQAVNQSKQQMIYQNALKQQSAKAVIRMPPQQTNFGLTSVTTTTQSTLTSLPSIKPTVTQSILTSQSSLQQPKVTIRQPTATVQTVPQPPLNPPLIISSSPQKPQLNVATNAGQTILLPANFAGMAGKVLIVSNPGKPSQAIAINPSGAQTVVSIQNQAGVSSKPVLLLPNNSSVAKLQQQQTHLPPTNALRMIVPNNPAIQPIRQMPPITPQVPALTPVSLSTFQNIRPKAMAQPIRNIQPSSATVNKVFIAPPKNLNLQPAIQQIPTQIQQISTTPQQIPISMQQLPTSLPKVPSTLQQIPASLQKIQTTANPSLPSSIQQLAASLPKVPASLQQIQMQLPKVQTTVQQIINQTPQVPTSTITLATTSHTIVKTTASNSVSIVSVKPSSSTSNSTLFDKTMSQHLLQLEKTDPHLFKGGKFHITQPTKPTKTSTPMNLQSKQDKIKMFLQQQQLLQKNQQVEQKQPLLITTTQATSNTPSTVLGSLSSGAQPTSFGTSSVNSNVTKISQQLITGQQQQKQASSAEIQNQTLQELLRKQRQQQLASSKPAATLGTPTPSQKEIFSQILAAAANSANLTPQQKQAAQQNLELYLLQQKILQAQQQQIQQQQQPNRIQKQMVKPRIETNIKKVLPQQIQPTTQSSILPMSSSTNLTNNQPLKLLSSLTNMVNLIPNSLKVTVASTTASQKTRVTQSLNITQPGVTSTGVGVQPLLFQLANANKAATAKANVGTVKQQFTAAQLQELQKNYLAAQIAAAGSKANQGQTPPTAVQMGSTSVTINTKIPIQTVPTTKLKSAFVPKAKTKQSATPVNLQQAQINHLIQQGVLTPSATNSIPPLAKIQNTVTLSKSLHEQLKGLTPVQRDLFIKQYSATAAGKQLQASLSTTANPALLASILKNRQALPTAIISPKGVVQSQTEQQTPKKGPKGPRGIKRNIAEVITPKVPEESPIEKRLKVAIADDQRKFLHQNYKRPFTTYQDAFSRLRAFHISYEPEEKKEHTEKYDLLFSGFASNAIEKKRQLLDKFHHLMLREATIGWPSADDVLMGRLYGSNERERFEQQKKTLADGRAFVVQNKDTGRLECVALSIKEEKTGGGNSTETNNYSTGLQLSEVDNRLRIASKDIRNCEMHTEDEEDEEEKEEEIEDDDDEATDEAIPTEEEGLFDDDDDEEEVNLTEEIEVEEVENDDTLIYEGQDNELAAATTNLIADMDEDDEYELDFS